MNKELQKLPPFADEVMSKLRRFDECANDFEADGVDIGRDWLDTLTHLGLLDRAQRSPAMWQTTPEGDALLEAYGPPAAMDESNFAPGGWKIERTPDGGFCLSHPTHGRGFFSDKGHKPAVVVSRFLDVLLTYGPTAERLQAENAALQQRLTVADQRVDDLESALKFYADKEHFHFDEPEKWDSVSGEAENLLWHEEDPAYIEDGSIARNALKVRVASAEDSSAPVNESLPPVEGDVLPPIGSTVQIQLGDSGWFDHTVTGYYVWPNHGLDSNVHRVFVRVKDDHGTPNARLLADIRVPQ